MKHEVRLPLTAQGRLDRALADALGVGRAAVKRAFQLGDVRVGGRRARASDAVTPGGLVVVELEPPAGPPAPEPEAPLRVLVEHPRLLVVEKPAGVAVHPLAPGEGGTLANAVVARHPECAEASPDPREGGAVQRLDLETSGCVLFARDREAWEELHEALRARRVEKLYLALVLGRVTSGGVLSVPLAQRGGRVLPAPDEIAVERLAAKGATPRPAETHYDVERSFERFTLLRVRIVTGVMHQNPRAPRPPRLPGGGRHRLRRRGRGGPGPPAALPPRLSPGPRRAGRRADRGGEPPAGGARAFSRGAAVSGGTCRWSRSVHATTGRGR